MDHHPRVRIRKSNYGDWMVEEWVYSSWKDTKDWVRSAEYSGMFAKTRAYNDYNERLERFGRATKSQSAVWHVVEEQ